MRFLVILFLTLAMSMTIVQAKSVQVTGYGVTEESAIHNAMRLAIEQEAGVYIDSKTYVKNHQLINSEISSNSQGYIEGYEILSKSVVNGTFEILMRVEVNDDKLRTELMSTLQKKTIIETNMDDPRIAVIALDSYGREYVDVENEIISALQRNSFTHVIDLNQLDASIKMRLRNAGDDALRQSLKNQFHVDYLITARVSVSESDGVKLATLATRMTGVNTGEIIYAESVRGESRMFTNNTAEEAIRSAAKRAAQSVANAALKKAALVEQHATIIITKNTFNHFGNLDKIIERIEGIQGVNDVFVRNFSNSTAELDVNFDGTTYDLANALNLNGLSVSEMNSEYIKI